MTGESLPGLLTPEAALHRLADPSARFAGVYARVRSLLAQLQPAPV